MIATFNAAYLHSYKKVMPANLNALIRYKTIDRCLSNPYRKWTIADLAEACSEALEENRGTKTGISERTIREDIRVMRSDILGFNAPIVQKDGNYFYEERSYSIFNVTIQDTKLLKRILHFILEIRSEVDHPDIEKIIEHIYEALPGRKLTKETEIIKAPRRSIRHPSLFEREIPEPEAEEKTVSEETDTLFSLEAPMRSDLRESIFTREIRWSMILDLI